MNDFEIGSNGGILFHSDVVIGGGYGAHGDVIDVEIDLDEEMPSED